MITGGQERRRFFQETGARRERGGEHCSSVVSGGGHCSSFGGKRGQDVGRGGAGWVRAPSWPRAGPPGPPAPRPPGPVPDGAVLLLALLLQPEDPLLQPADHLPGDHACQADRGPPPASTARAPCAARRCSWPCARPGAGSAAHSLGCPPHSIAGVSSRLGAGGRGGGNRVLPLLKGRQPHPTQSTATLGTRDGTRTASVTRHGRPKPSSPGQPHP